MAVSYWPPACHPAPFFTSSQCAYGICYGFWRMGLASPKWFSCSIMPVHPGAPFNTPRKPSTRAWSCSFCPGVNVDACSSTWSSTSGSPNGQSPSSPSFQSLKGPTSSSCPQPGEQKMHGQHQLVQHTTSLSGWHGRPSALSIDQASLLNSQQVTPCSWSCGIHEVLVAVFKFWTELSLNPRECTLQGKCTVIHQKHFVQLALSFVIVPLQRSRLAQIPLWCCYSQFSYSHPAYLLSLFLFSCSSLPLVASINKDQQRRYAREGIVCKGTIAKSWLMFGPHSPAFSV